MFATKAFRLSLCLGTAVLALTNSVAHAEEAAADPGETIVVNAKSTRSATAISGAEIQKILPGVAPFKAMATLPGVLYITADPWGNNEQNAQLFIHGFSASQLGYTFDGVPLGDQNYGNFNGLSPQRAVISENVARTVVATGAGDLGIASTSNLGGAVEVSSRDPENRRGLEAIQTVGSYGTSRTFLRLDSGDLGGGNRLYLSGSRQRARAWDFGGVQGGYQANGKFTHEDSVGKLTAYFAYSDKIEPNEDATTVYVNPTTAAQAYQPYTRPFTYPSWADAKAYVDATGQIVDQNQSVNYRNYYSDAQRTDHLGYLKYDLKLSDKITWSNQVYMHHNDGVGVVAGPLQFVWNSPIKYYYPTLTQATFVSTVDPSAYIVRTTEYRIERQGAITTINAQVGAHKLEAGAWFQHNSSHAYRRWYALDANNIDGFSPYIRPSNPLFTQYAAEMRVNTLQLHVQDSWQVTPALLVEAGVKSSAQYANGWFSVQPAAGSLAGASAALPSGRINTAKWFLPTIGAKWDATGQEQVYFNIQKNQRQYQAYGGGGSADPWSTSSQAAFDYIKANGQPESSWTYELGLRTKHSFTDSPLTSLEAQINYYHVDFSNRLLAVSAASGGIAGGSISGGTTSLFNVGSVKTNGVDAAVTLRFGRNLSIFNATSYNSSIYGSDYSTATGAATGTSIGGYTVVNNVVPTGGKQLAGSPKWMNKTVVTINAGPVEAQLFGDYVGKRFATYVNDGVVGAYFLASARVAVKLPQEMIHARKAELSLNVTNLFDSTGRSTISVTQSASYSVYPIAPRQVFATLALGF
jgi:iron complex outermembrane receptor protein